MSELKNIENTDFDKNNITILCKVVDNFGDIGVVYRLAKSLSELNSDLKITIVCSHLESFAKMAKNVDASKKIQTIQYKNSTWTIIDWNLESCHVEELKKSALPISDFSFPIILECFQCGRPDWIENEIFAPQNTKIHKILNVEYLTGEEYAEDFHCLNSYTRSPLVKKMFFMPGFTNKTGGLIIDDEFNLLAQKKLELSKIQKDFSKENFIVTLFSYERNFDDIFESLIEFQNEQRQKNPAFTVEVLAADGKSLPFVKDAWQKSGQKIKLTILPFLLQEEYDKILSQADVNFVRGEETLVRASLLSTPFVWQAYLQEENYQLVKVDAFLDHLLPHFEEKNAQILKTIFDDYNTPEKILNKNDLNEFFENCLCKDYIENFANFSSKLLQNGNLAENILKCVGII